MALNETSKYGAADGLFDDIDININTQKKKKAHEVQEVQNREIGTTQGKKGQKLNRINMAYSDLNYEYIKKESRRRGMTATAFVNQIIDEYRKK